MGWRRRRKCLPMRSKKTRGGRRGWRGSRRCAVFEAAQEAGAKPEAANFCDQLLAGTDAVAVDLGAWLVERHTGAKKGQAERHDILHLQHAPRCASAFPRGEMERTVRRWGE